MDNYGWATHGGSFIENINERPIWSSDNISRIIYDITVGCCWIGGISDIVGDSGWFRIGLDNNIIKFNNIIWDLEFIDNNKVSTNSIPCKIKDLNNVISLQLSIDYLLDEISFLSKGELLKTSSIHSNHLDIYSLYKCNAKSFPIFNQNGYFPSNIVSIEDSLNLIKDNCSNLLFTDSFFNFDKLFSNYKLSICDSILQIEQYLSLISATSISATNINYNNVQSGLDFNYQLLKSIGFNDLIGVSSDLNFPQKFVSTNGIDKIYYENIYAENVKCFYSDILINKKILQDRLYNIKDSIIDIDILIDNSIKDSKLITYHAYSKFDNVESVLDWLIQNSLNERQLKASDLSICGIDDTYNVQETLLSLQNQFQVLLLSFPTHFLAKNITYFSNMGHVNLQESLDYLFNEFFNVSRIGKPGKVGESGPPGRTGIIGPIGPVGEMGRVGPPGAPGYRGEAGINGCPGIPGDYGPPGETGITGGTGFSGSSGFDGCPGLVGGTGSIGGTGASGISGPLGSPGLDNHISGPTGGIGGTGSPGVSGYVSGVGLTGAPGAPGITGGVGGTGHGSTCLLITGGTGATGGIGGTGADCIEQCEDLLMNNFRLCVGSTSGTGGTNDLPELPPGDTYTFRCFCHMSGVLIGNNSRSSTKIYVEDLNSHIVGVGNYPDVSTVFPKAIASSFDGMVLGTGIKFQMWSGRNYTGTKFIDCTGPLVVIDQHLAELPINEPILNEDYFDPILQSTFPQSVRKKSNEIVNDPSFSEMDLWELGSCKITCI